MPNDIRVPSNIMDARTTEWLATLKNDGEKRGYFKPLGPDHYAVFTATTTTLLVTFETFDSIQNDTKNEMPLGFDLVSENDWSHLGIIANGNTWFRDDKVFDYFDRLTDDGFFDKFDQIVFAGSGMCGYAAAAFSVAAPGSTVLAFNPQATLDPNVTEWDHRFQKMRRTSFTGRYGYAPDMVEAADRVFVFYDPEDEMDAMHASLFTAPHITKLRCRHLGQHIMNDMIHMGILQLLVDVAGSSGDVAKRFRRAFRARHRYTPYLRRLLMRLDDDDRMVLAGLLCRNVVNRISAPRFQRRLNAIESNLAASGRLLPALASSQLK